MRHALCLVQVFERCVSANGCCTPAQVNGCCIPVQVNECCISVQVSGSCIPVQVNGCCIPAQVHGHCIPVQVNGCCIPAQVNTTSQWTFHLFRGCHTLTHEKSRRVPAPPNGRCFSAEANGRCVSESTRPLPCALSTNPNKGHLSKEAVRLSVSV